EPVTSAGDLDALRLGTGRTWLRLGLGKSNYGDRDVTVVAEREGGAVRLVDMRNLPLGAAGDADVPVEKTPGELGLLVGQSVSVRAVTMKLLNTTTNPS